ncbi:uncharacterized protein LOC144810565 [Lissotriton helveticus]
MGQTAATRAQCFMMKVSETPEENPMFQIKIGDKEIDFLIDSGATLSAVRNKLGPGSGETVTTIAVNGMMMHEELSEPLPVSVDDFTMTHQFLLSPDAPINLLGRDLLCKLHATLYFSQNGIYLQVPENRLELANRALTACKLSEDSVLCAPPVFSLSPTRYQWTPLHGDFYENMFQELFKYSPDIESELVTHLVQLTLVPEPMHCTAAFFTGAVPEWYTYRADKHLHWTMELFEHTLYVGKEGCAVSIKLGPQEMRLFQVPDSEPHVSIAVAPGYYPKDLGPMVKRLQDLPRTKDFTFPLGLVSVLGDGEGWCWTLCMNRKDRTAVFDKLEGNMALQLTKNKILEQVNSEVWAKHKNEAGLLKTCPPHKVTLKENAELPYVRQYRLSPQAEEGIKPVIESLLQQGIIKKTSSPCNSPIIPLPKGNTGQYRFIQDLRQINNIVVPLAPVVPDTNTILSSIPVEAEYFSVIDLSSAFFSIRVHPESEYLFAFTVKDTQYTFRRLAKGYTESPTVYAQAVKRDLDSLHLEGGSIILQYADDLLVASPSLEACEKDTVALLNHLQERGHKASLSKFQCCQKEVTYLGYVVSKGTRRISPDRIKMIQGMQPPSTKKGMLSFLGMMNYCRQWIPEYRSYYAILRQCTLQDAPNNIVWTNELANCFKKLKETLCTAPALGLPDYKLPFHLYVSELNGIANGVLTQQHGSGKRPVAYYSVTLPAAVTGHPACLRAVASAAVMVERTAPIVLDYPMCHIRYSCCCHLQQHKLFRQPGKQVMRSLCCLTPISPLKDAHLLIWQHYYLH